MEDFETYDSYCDYVIDAWKHGYLNELIEDNLLIDTQAKHKDGTDLIGHVEWRLLTEQEFNERFKD